MTKLQRDDGYRVLRGGSWFHVARHVRCAARFAIPDNRVSDLGFRPVAEVKAAPESDRMLHGGAWNYAVRNVRCTFRHARVPGRRYEYYGLRPVAEVKESPESDRVLCGGSWIDFVRFVLCAHRFASIPNYRYEFYGVRPVAEVKEVPAEEEPRVCRDVSCRFATMQGFPFLAVVQRICRGGSFWFAARICRSACQIRREPGSQFRDRGLRPVAEVKEISSERKDRVLRGGSWYYDAAHCRAAIRDWGGPGWRLSNYGFRPVALALILLLTCLLFEGCTTPRCSDFCGPGEARFCLPDDMRHALEKVDEMEKTGDRGPCHWDGPRYLITRHYLGARNDFQTEISRTVILMPGDAQCILIVESLRKDSPTGRQTETFLVPVTVEER